MLAQLQDVAPTRLATLVLGGLVASLFLYALLVSFYRLTFHPLASYPGPFLAKITDWHQVYHAYHGNRHLSLYLMHEKYGPFVRYGPNALSTNTATALHSIYGFHSSVQKGNFYTAFPANKHAYNTHSSIDKAQHSRKRRVLSHAFSDGAVKAMERYILQNVRAFTDGLGASSKVVGEERKGWGLGQNMADWCNYLTFDVMGDLCFGKAFGMLEKEDNRFAIELIGNAAHRHLICGTMPLLHEYHLDHVLFPHLAAGRQRYMAYSKSQSVERMKNPDVDRKDFFYYLLKAKDPETGASFALPELWAESNLLIIAGSDTTSTALAAAFFYLVHNPATLQIAQNEVRDAFSDEEEIVAGATLNSCTYLRAVLDESMRLSAPVGGILPREVIGKGLDIDGHHFPAGVDVGTSHYAVHHNPAYYPDPFAFKPERWIVAGETTQEDVTKAKSAFCAFSVGPRACIGRALAYTELMISLGRVLYTFDMRLAGGMRVGEGGVGMGAGRERQSEYQLKDSFTSLKDGPMVEFRRR
ncbi:hypothetical protein V490_03168 [Pseudogymnoascus sp. VKM F-3557]|nr:hypothetical protein V490_03168 [Pseudogymnoascus sp. VKM F-3557]